MTIGTLLRPAAPSGPVPTNASILDDARVETIDASDVVTHAFVPDRNSTITVSARAVAQKVGDDTKYAALSIEAVVRTSATGVVTLTASGVSASIYGPLTGIDLKVVALPAVTADHVEVQVKGLASPPVVTLRWQVSVQIFQLDQSG